MFDKLNSQSQRGYREGNPCLSIHVCHPASLYARASGGVTVCSDQRGMWLPVHTCQVNESGSTGGCQLWFPFWMNLWHLWPVLILCALGCISCHIQVWGFLTDLCAQLGWLFPCFLLCRWYCVCLPWAVPFVWGPVDSLLSSSAPPLTGSILGPQKPCSRSATGSSKRSKALRSDHLNPSTLSHRISHRNS